MVFPQPCFIPAVFKQLIQLETSMVEATSEQNNSGSKLGAGHWRGTECQQPIRGLAQLGAQRGCSVLPGGNPKELEQAHKHSCHAMDDSSQPSQSDSGTSQ